MECGGAETERGPGMSRIKKQLEICPPAYMCKGTNRENFVSTGHKCGYCKGNGWFWGTEEGSREDVLPLMAGLIKGLRTLSGK